MALVCCVLLFAAYRLQIRRDEEREREEWRKGRREIAG